MNSLPPESVFPGILSMMKPRKFLPICLFHYLLLGGLVQGQTNEGPPVDKGLLDFLKVVEDADGYTNLRAGASLEAKIVGKVLSGGPVFAEPEAKSGFHLVYLDREDGETERYLHGSRLKPVNRWKTIAPEGATGRLSHKTFLAEVSATGFDAGAHRISRNADGMTLVDGKVPWGQDGGEPRRGLKLSVSIGGRKVEIPAAATENLYEPNLETLVLLTPGDPAGRAFLMMQNSDGAGGYVVVWAFEKGIYRGRAVIMP